MPTYSPLWTKQQKPALWNRSALQYSRIKLAELKSERGIESPLVDALSENLPIGAWVAGGFPMNFMRKTLDKAGDIDLYFSGPGPFENTLNLLLNGTNEVIGKYEIESESNALFSLKPLNPGHKKIQAIKIQWCDDAAHVIDNFDWTVSQFAIDGEDLVYNPMAIIDLAQNKLVLHRLHTHTDALYRLIKYLKKGFYPTTMTLDKLTAEIGKQEVLDPNQGSPVRARNRAYPQEQRTLATNVGGGYT